MAKAQIALFFLLVFGLTLLFVLYPAGAHGLKGWIAPLLGVVMFSMGTTLSWEDFSRIRAQKGIVTLALFLQYSVMPFSAWMIGTLLGLPAELLIGLIIVGASPGGTASNVMTYLAGGNVALSVTLTTLSTLLSILLTPLLVRLYLDASIALDTAAMILTIFKIVILPVLGGVLLSRYLPKAKKVLEPAASYLSLSIIALIIAIILGLNQGNPGAFFSLALVAVIVHNASGLASGYFAVRLAGGDHTSAKTVAIEVGMQNSGLAVVLATKFFGVGSAVAGAIFSLWHNISGIILATWWQRNRKEKEA